VVRQAEIGQGKKEERILGRGPICPSKSG